MGEVVPHPTRDEPMPEPVVDRDIVQELELMLREAKRGNMVNLSVAYVNGKGQQYTRIICGTQMLSLHSGIAYLLHRMNKFMDERG